MRLKKTIFLSFEGAEGVGKTTQIQLLYSLLQKQGYSCLLLREPGGNLVAETLRDIVLSNKYSTSSITDTLLFTAARHENIINNILPNLDKIDFILCDRFVLSSLVYQGIVANIGIEVIYELHQKFNFNLFPDLTILLDCYNTQNRLQTRKENNKIDNNGKDFHSLVKKAFSNVDEYYFAEVVKINSDNEISSVQEDILSVIQNKYNLKFDFNLK